MAERKHAPVSVRFGAFDVSLDTQELRKHGIRLKLSGQAIQVLLILLEIPGQLVTREELQQQLWPGASFGDFEHGLNAAVNRLREVLGDSATDPKFIETIPRRGYRFIGQIEKELLLKESVITVLPTRDSLEIRPRLGRHWILLLSAGGVLLTLCSLVYVLVHQRRKSLDEMKVIPFTTYPGFEAAPSFSPDGNEIAFSWFRPEQDAPLIKADLYVKQIGNESPVRLTNHEAKFLVPAWSPDGRNIAFGMVGKDGDGIYLIPALGGRERLLAKISDANWQWLLLSWSPDSKWLAFASASRTQQTVETDPTERYRIHLLNVETAEERVLPDPAPDCTMTIEPAISPDGKFLASVCVLTFGVNKLFVQQIDGKLPRQIAQVSTSFVPAGLAWSADGHSIIYSTYGTTSRLWRVPAEGGRPEQLPFPRETQNPAIARVGNRLAYAQSHYNFDVWSLPLGARGNDIKPERFISSTWDQGFPQISRDGKLIAFNSNRSGNDEIWICDRDGSKPVQLTSFDGPQTGQPHWSADGKQIIFNSNLSGKVDLHLVSVDGGRSRQVPTGTPNAVSPFWSADSRWIYFATQQPNGIWKITPEGGVAIRLAKDGAYPQESADGKRVFYVVRGERSELWSVSVNGGDERHESGMPPLPYDVLWTPVQDGIYFIDGVPSHFFVNYFDFASRRAKRIQDIRNMSFICCGITVSRDNNTLLFSGIDKLESDIVLVENFR